MKKIFIVTKKNEEKSTYESKTIVIFDDNKAPRIINYASDEDLLPVVNAAEENGFDILGQNGIKPAIESGLIQIVSFADKKAIDDLKANILKEEIKYLDFKEEVKEEIKKEIKEEISETEEENKITAKTTMFKPVVSNVDLPIDEREYADYLRLNILRSKNQIDKAGLSKIEQMTKYNEKVAEMEKARKDVIEANDKVKTLTRFNSSSLSGAIEDLNKKQKAYDDLAEKFRNELSEAIKKYTNSDVVVSKDVEDKKKVLSLENREVSVPSIKEEKVEMPTVEPVLKNETEEVPVIEEPTKKEVVELPAVVAPVEEKVEEAAKETPATVIPVETVKSEGSALDVEEPEEEIKDEALEAIVEKLEAQKEAALGDGALDAVVEEPKAEEEVIELPIEEKVEEISEDGALDVEEPKAEEVVELPTTEEKVEEEVVELPIEEKVEEEVVELPTTEEKVEEEVVELPIEEKEEVVELPVEEKEEIEEENISVEDKKDSEEISGPKHFNGEYVEESVKHGKHEAKAEEEKPGYALKKVEKEVVAKGVNPETDEEYDVELEDETIKAKTTSKLKKFFKAVGYVITTAVIAAGVHLGLDHFFGRKNNNNINVFPTEKTRLESSKSYFAPYPTPTADATLEPTATPTLKPTATPTLEPTAEPTAEPTVEPTLEPTAEPTAEPTVEPTAKPVAPVLNVSAVMANYVEAYNVPEATRNFLNQEEVLNFLSQYKNEDQLNEVLSALCYGYEANILTTKDGNFRMTEDGENYLTSFTHDFLCAKVVVNRYDARQMAAVFGGSNMSYEELINGFQSYTHTVRTYFMNAEEPLPFHYLTNNDKVATEELNKLQNKIIVVNQNRRLHTLTSTHTDDFISAVFDLYVVNDETLNMSEGAKTVGAAIVDAFCAMQAQVSNGEALYLHEDRGLAKAGINLADVDGHFTFEYPDKTHYEFTSLFDVMNHGYGDVNETAYRCLSQQEELLASLNAMQTLDLSNLNGAKETLMYSLYEEGLEGYAIAINNGNITDKLLDEILSVDPMLYDEVNAVKYSRDNKASNYVSFKETYEGVDRLLGISNRKTNNYSVLINNRRDSVMYYNDYTITSGKRYTKRPGGGYGRGGRPQNEETVTHVTETTTTTEKVEFEDLTPAEQTEALEQIEELKEQEEQEHQEQQEQIEETVAELQDGVAEGKTQEELEIIAEEGGITLDPDYQENMAEALEEQRQGEEKREQIEAEVEQHNKEEEEAARRREEEEKRKQDEERRKEEELIQKSEEIKEVAAPEQHEEVVVPQAEEIIVISDQGIDPLAEAPVVEEPVVEEPVVEQPVVEQPVVEQPAEQPVVEEPVVEQPAEEIPVVIVEPEQPAEIHEGTTYSEDHDGAIIDQTDDGRVDLEAGEEPYTGKLVRELKELRAMALEMNVDTEGLSLGKRFNGRA